MSTEPAGISIRNLGLAFGDNEVLKDISLDIAPGEFFAFLGPSGSGKSTLLRAVAGFGPQPAGEILISGQNVVDLPPWERNLGMVFQSYALWPHMTVRRNVAFGLEERRLPARDIAGRVEQALELVGLTELAERRPSQLSGGQQQRVAIARTIVIEPKVLLLDEPLSNLDANLRIQMRRDIRALQQRLQLTTIFVTHDQEEANTTSDRMAVLNDGYLQQVGTPMELYDNPVNLFVARFLGTANILSGRIVEEGGKKVFVSDSGVNFSLAIEGQGQRSIVFRPQNASIQCGRAEGDEAHIALPGSVVHTEFLGSTVRYGIRVGEETLLLDQPHIQGEGLIAEGTEVTVLVARERILALAG
jgi:iron(III) transport system ATP-binding protein